GPSVVAGQALDRAYTEEHLGLVEQGLANLERHVRNSAHFGVPVVVALNRFTTDTQPEVDLVLRRALAAGAAAAVPCTHWAEGGRGALALAEAVAQVCRSRPDSFRFLYPLELSIREKIETICTQVYKAGSVQYLPEAEAKLALYTR